MSKKQEQLTQKPASVVADGMTLGVIGTGVMGQTLLRGLLDSGLIPRERIWGGTRTPPPANLRAGNWASRSRRISRAACRLRISS